jgi:hypothetical protein
MAMKTRLLLALILVLTLAPVSAPASDAVPMSASDRVTKTYGEITALEYSWLGGSVDRWDLVGCDLIMSYSLDMSEHFSSMEDPIWALVGLWGPDRELGWMASGAPKATDTDDVQYDLDDKLNLSAPPDRFDEWTYDATDPDIVLTSPISSSYSFGIWFDRDGISPEETHRWILKDGQTYNTYGKYDVVITFHAISPTLGTMFATVNGAQTGFYDAWVEDSAPDHYPAGKSISGDLSNARGFVFHPGQDVHITDLTVSGCPWTRNYLPLVVCN